nr:unnamed protein product [Callosobruchus chinensis]
MTSPSSASRRLRIILAVVARDSLVLRFLDIRRKPPGRNTGTKMFSATVEIASKSASDREFRIRRFEEPPEWVRPTEETDEDGARSSPSA